MKRVMKIVKDGTKLRVLVKEVDTSKPKIEMVGHEYRFNNRIVADKSFSALEFSKAIGFDFRKGDIDWE